MNTRTALRRMAAQDVPTADRMRRASPEGLRAHSLHRILGARRAHPTPEPAPGGRRWGPVLVVGVVVVAVLAAVAVFVLPGAVGERRLDGVAEPALAPSLPPITSTDVREVLEQLADRAAARPPLPDAEFDYIRTTSWEAPTLPDGQPDLDAPRVQQDSEAWRGDAEQRLVHLEGGRIVRDSGVGSAYAPRVADLPTEPDALADVLSAQIPQILVEARPCLVMQWLWWHQAIQPQVQAAFLRLLATRGEVRLEGPVTDPIGRQGIAVVVTDRGTVFGDPPGAEQAVVESTLVLDPATGDVLHRAPVLVRGGEGSYAYAGPHPVTLGSTTVVGTGRVDSTTERP